LTANCYHAKPRLPGLRGPKVEPLPRRQSRCAAGCKASRPRSSGAVSPPKIDLFAAASAVLPPALHPLSISQTSSLQAASSRLRCRVSYYPARRGVGGTLRKHATPRAAEEAAIGRFPLVPTWAEPCERKMEQPVVSFLATSHKSEFTSLVVVVPRLSVRRECLSYLSPFTSSVYPPFPMHPVRSVLDCT
jgi:hypothetical protein